jgi:DNA-directed RNA polymerase II subunit RPB2
MKAS